MKRPRSWPPYCCRVPWQLLCWPITPWSTPRWVNSSTTHSLDIICDIAWNKNEKKNIYIYTLHYIDVLFIYVHYQYCQTFNLKCILLLLLGLKLFCKDVFVHRSWLEVLPPRARTADPVSPLPEAWPTPKWLQKTRNGTSSRNSIYILWLHI